MAPLPQVRILSQVLFQVLEGESILLDLQQEQYFGLNEVGTRFWQLLAETADVPAVAAQLLAEFDVDEATLHQDLADLIAALLANGLVAAVDDVAAGA